MNFHTTDAGIDLQQKAVAGQEQSFQSHPCGCLEKIEVEAAVNPGLHRCSNLMLDMHKRFT